MEPRPVCDGDSRRPRRNLLDWIPILHDEGGGFDAAFTKLLWPLVPALKILTIISQPDIGSVVTNAFCLCCFI